MKNIIRASIILSWATLISLVVAVIKRKLLAVYLGPYGLGIYAQVFNYFNVAAIIATFGLSQAITTYIARNDNIAVGKEVMADVLKSAMSILLFLSLALVLISGLFSKSISALVINDSSLYYLLILAAIGIPFQVLGQAFLSFLQGIKKVKRISLANIGISILGLLGTIPLVIYFGTLGAVISILFLAIITFLIFSYASRDSMSLKFLWRLFYFQNIFKSPHYAKLINFGSLRFVQTGLFWLTFFAMRIIIIKKLGPASNGIYEAAYTFSLLYLPFISNILWSYSYPEYCRAQTNNALSEAVNKFLRLSITIAFPIIVFLILARSILIEKIVFTSQFSAAIGLLPIRLIVDFLTIITWSFNVVLLAKERLKVAVGFEIIRDISFLGLVVCVVSTRKLPGILGADILCFLLLLLLSYIYIKKHFGFRLSGNNLYLLTSSIAIISIISLFPVNNPVFIIVGLTISAGWFKHFVSFTEIKEALSSLRITNSAK